MWNRGLPPHVDREVMAVLDEQIVVTQAMQCSTQSHQFSTRGPRKWLNGLGW